MEQLWPFSHAAPPVHLSPLPFKGRKVDLITDECRVGKGSLQPPAAPSKILSSPPCSGLLQNLGLGELAGNEGVPWTLLPTCIPCGPLELVFELGKGADIWDYWRLEEWGS